MKIIQCSRFFMRYALFAILVLSLPSLATAQEANRATLEPLLGVVEVLPAAEADTDNWQPVESIREVSVGDRIRTDSNGWAVLTFFEGTVTEILSDTEVLIQRLELPEGEGRFTISLEQVVGDTFSTASEILDEDSSFEISSPTSTLAVRGTEFYVLVTPTGEVNFATLTGEVQATPLGTDAPTTFDIPSGQTLTFSPASDAPTPLEAVIVPDTPSDSPEVVDDGRVGVGTLIIPFVDISPAGIELFPEPTRESARRVALLEDFTPYVAGLNAEGDWVYMYYFANSGIIDGWSPLEQLELSEAQLELLPNVSEMGSMVLPRLPQTTLTTIPGAPGREIETEPESESTPEPSDGDGNDGGETEPVPPGSNY